ncbi:MAG: leucine--tRNA ligase, partial [Anaerolineae bacterium]
EPKWQKKWDEDGLYKTVEDPNRPKWYFLTMYPYPSGDLHIGHWYAMAPSDVKARYLRMKGYNVFFPIGFDAFGLPAENAAIKHGIHPYVWTYRNIENMRRQLRSMGAMWAWDREAVTCDPKYYKWTQWFFLQFYKNGLAYRAKVAVDFCPSCNTTLAREQVWGEDRHCERCGTPVIKKELEQWLFRITKYSEELLDFSKIDWPEKVRTMQTNWIGRSRGVEFDLKVKGTDKKFRVFTTRADTVYGMTFAVLAPEHPLTDELTSLKHKEEVEAYKFKTARQSEIERLSTEKVQDGVFIGAYAINPMNGAEIPIYIADYVMMTYGTGAIMGVPAHDERDFAFAKRYGLPIPVVIAPPGWDGEELEEAYLGPGTMVNSGPFNGLVSFGKYQVEEWTKELAREHGLPEKVEKEAKEAVAEWMEERGIGKRAVHYRLHDWLISRQRYWGAPIPIIYCEKCGTVPVPEEDLPVLLPEDAEFLPTGESPLKYHEGFRYATCPKCGGSAERETDTMDTFMCSSWYQLRYVNPDYEEGPIDPEKGKYWLPVDQYTGGIEHATMHLLYTRFFTKAIRDCGIWHDDEPMLRLYNQGIILGEDGEKMSKSRGNVVDPDDLVQRYGADTFRTYLMFIGPWDEGGPWSSRGIEGVWRFMNQVWRLVLEKPEKIETQDFNREHAERELKRWIHGTIRDVTERMEAFRFNTMVSKLMEFANYLSKAKNTPLYGTELWDEGIRTLLLLMAPSAPHITEELWVRLGKPYSIHQQSWPVWDERLASEEFMTLLVQVNGKLRDKIEVPAGIGEEKAKELALKSERVQRHLQGKKIVKTIFAEGRLVNIVVR